MVRQSATYFDGDGKTQTDAPSSECPFHGYRYGKNRSIQLCSLSAMPQPTVKHAERHFDASTHSARGYGYAAHPSVNDDSFQATLRRGARICSRLYSMSSDSSLQPISMSITAPRCAIIITRARRRQFLPVRGVDTVARQRESVLR